MKIGEYSSTRDRSGGEAFLKGMISAEQRSLDDSMSLDGADDDEEMSKRTYSAYEAVIHKLLKRYFRAAAQKQTAGILLIDDCLFSTPLFMLRVCSVDHAEGGHLSSDLPKSK